jgi:hypothetical protein
MRRVAVAVVATATLALTALAAAQAQDDFVSTGGTTVSVEGSVVRIAVNIDFVLPIPVGDEIPEGAQEEADGIAKEIADYWNQGFERLGTDCIRLELEVDINVVHGMTAPYRRSLGEDRPPAWATAPGRHVVFWRVNPFGNSAPPLTYDPYDADGVALPGEDFSSPLEHEIWAEWSEYLENPRDFAHEFGHLLGFGDDYGEGDAELPGREGTLMAHGDLIDQNLVNRLAELARGANPDVPACEMWAGTWEGGTALPGCSPSFVPLHGTISFTVAADGSLSGTYAVAHETFVCGLEAQPDARFGGEFTGREIEGEFVLDVFAGTGYGPVRLRRDENDAVGSYRVGPQEGEITVECTNCG